MGIQSSSKKIEYYESGKVKAEHLLNNLEIYSIIEYYESGIVKSRTWYEKGQFHRKEGPAVVEYFENGDVKLQSWCKAKFSHRTDGPAFIVTHVNSDFKKSGMTFVYKNKIADNIRIVEGKSTCRIEKWYKNGLLHNPKGPAVIYYKDEEIYREEYWVSGKFKSEKQVSGLYYSNGQIREEYVYKNDKSQKNLLESQNDKSQNDKLLELQSQNDKLLELNTQLHKNIQELTAKLSRGLEVVVEEFKHDIVF